MGNNVIIEKSFEFSVRIVNLAKYLRNSKKSIHCPGRFCVVEQA